MDPKCKIITSKTFSNRHMHIYDIKLEKNDRLVFCSDGVTQSGLGGPNLKLGLRREGLIDIVLRKIKKDPLISSTNLSKYIVQQAENIETDRKAKDDISACVLYCREPRESLVFTGPPYHIEKDNQYAKVFDDFQGKKAICGGTTANLLSRELNRQITTDITKSTGNLPACSEMDGVDLITEGILTLTKAVEYLEEDEKTIPKDAAGNLVRFLLDSDCILFMVGAKINQAHYDPNLPIEIEIRKNIIKKMATLLEDKYFKKITVQYM